MPIYDWEGDVPASRPIRKPILTGYVPPGLTSDSTDTDEGEPEDSAISTDLGGSSGSDGQGPDRPEVDLPDPFGGDGFVVVVVDEDGNVVRTITVGEYESIRVERARNRTVNGTPNGTAVPG